jgi:hypothetical protein
VVFEALYVTSKGVFVLTASGQLTVPTRSSGTMGISRRAAGVRSNVDAEGIDGYRLRSD